MLGEEAERTHGEAEQKTDQTYRLSIQQALHSEAAHTQLRKLAQQQSRTYRTVLRQLVVEGQATGEIADDDPDQLVAAVTACVAGLSQAATWQAPEQFQKTFPDVAIILRILIPRQKENTNA
jgi:hypothetical protein